MQLMTRCGRCGALVETTSERLSSGVVHYAPCAVATKISSNNVVVRDGCEYTVLCPDCMEGLKQWLAGGQTEDPSIAEGIIRDMYAALGAKPHRKQACEYLSERNPFMCARCMEDPKQCVGEMFKEIRRRCAEIGIDLEEDEDAR